MCSQGTSRGRVRGGFWEDVTCCTELWKATVSQMDREGGKGVQARGNAFPQNYTNDLFLALRIPDNGKSPKEFSIFYKNSIKDIGPMLFSVSCSVIPRTKAFEHLMPRSFSSSEKQTCFFWWNKWLQNSVFAFSSARRLRVKLLFVCSKPPS